MSKFIDIHRDLKGITEVDLRQAHQKDLDIEGEENVHFATAWADPDSGLVFCLSEGPDRGAVARVHERAGHPTDEIYPVPVEVG